LGAAGSQVGRPGRGASGGNRSILRTPPIPTSGSLPLRVTPRAHSGAGNGGRSHSGPTRWMTPPRSVG
jgi:hypothetical protein